MTRLAVRLAAAAALLGLASCSPEARRVRDGGAGADPGNKVLIEHEALDPHAADTTLWPGRATAPEDLLARGIIAPPTYPAGPPSPASPSQRRTFDRGQPSNHGQASDQPRPPDRP
jgi:hypothetical protein